jgi:peptide/nickel transport system substrate-binding protein
VKTTTSRLAGAVAALSLILASGCTAAGQSTGASGKALNVAAAATGPFVRSYNPLIVSTASVSGYSAYGLFEPLLQEDFGKGTTRPWLVTKFEWTDGGKSLVLHLRDDVKWSDGEPMTARDVAFTFETIRKNPGLNLAGFPLAGAETPDDTTAVIHFTKPSYQLMWWRTAVVPEHLWKGVKDPVTYANPEPVGTGPYTLESFTPQVVTLKRNPHYWGGAPKLETVRYVSFDSTNSMVAALQTGSVDWIGATGVDADAIGKRSKGLGWWSTKLTPGVVVLVPNEKVKPLDDVAVRQAMDAALDRPEISTVGTGGQNQPVASPTGLDLATRGKLLAPAYKDLRYGEADTGKAKQILTEAGYRLGGDGVFVDPNGKRLSFELMIPSDNAFGDFVRASKVMTRELAAAGIAVKVRTAQQTAWKEDVERGNFQLTMRSNGGTPSVFDFYNRIFDQQSLNDVPTQLNYEKYVNPKAQEYLALYSRSASGSAGEKQALQGLQELMVDDMPVLPIMFTAGLGMWRNDRFTGFPSADNAYAVPVPGSVNAELVLLGARPTS